MNRFIVLVAALLTAASAFGQARAKNVILFIGDGMGVQQVRAASFYAHGDDHSLAFQRLGHHALATTRSADCEITDSAAAGTAMSCGVKVNNHVVALAIPGDGKPLVTVLQKFQQRGAWTGLVTTDSLLGATPACFGAHAKKRGMARQIADDYLNHTKPNVLFGGGGPGLDAAQRSGYMVLADRKALIGLPGLLMKIRLAGPPHFIATFGSERFEYLYSHPQAYQTTHPKLADMTTAALRVLDMSPKGCFLMVESGLIDRAGHNHRVKDDTERSRCNIIETLELDRAVQRAIDWAKQNPDTLIIVTADHETGDLQHVEPSPAGQWPRMIWAGHDHTAAPVDVYASGPGAERVRGQIDNTDIARIIIEAAGLNVGSN